MSYGKVILNYGDSLIRESEITILKTNQWLNDAIIGFYFEYLSNQLKDKDSVVLYGPAVTQLLKLIQNPEEVPCILGGNPEHVQFAFWPVNDSSDTEKGSSGSHWSLLVFSRPDDKFIHFDSYGFSNEHAARQTYQKLKTSFSPKSSFQNFDGCCAQQNGRDCGLHVLMNAEIIIKFIETANHKAPSLLKSRLTTATPNQADKMRGQLLNLIERLSST